MKKTEHYDLNQWEKPDTIRMEDFNADNANIAAALMGLDAKIGGLPSGQDLDAVREQLEAADTRILKNKLGVFSQYGVPAEDAFHLSADGSRWEMNLKPYNPFMTALFAMDISFFGSNHAPRYYLNIGDMSNHPVCLSTDGVSKNGIAVLSPSSSPSKVIFFTFGAAGAPPLALFAGNGIVGVGCTTLSNILMDKLILTPSEGKPLSSHSIPVNLQIVKTGVPA